MELPKQIIVELLSSYIKGITTLQLHYKGNNVLFLDLMK